MVEKAARHKIGGPWYNTYIYMQLVSAAASQANKYSPSSCVISLHYFMLFWEETLVQQAVVQSPKYPAVYQDYVPTFQALLNFFGRGRWLRRI